MNDIYNLQINDLSYLRIELRSDCVEIIQMQHREGNTEFKQIGHVYIPVEQLDNLIKILKQNE